MKINKRSLMVIGLISLIATILIECVSWVLAPEILRTFTMPDDAESLFLSSEQYTSGYDIYNTTYTPNNGDPQLGFILSGGGTYKLLF